MRGGAKTGAFAEYAASALRHMPEWFRAAAAMAAYHTAYVALVEIGGLQAGQTVLVHGASGVWVLPPATSRALGGRVIAATHREDMLRAVAQPDAAILNTGRFREDIARLTDGRLCDLVFDPVGGDVFDEARAALRREAAGDRLRLGRIRKSRSISR